MEEIEFKKVVKSKRGAGYDVVHCTEEGKIGEPINKKPFKTREEAEKMHRAIQASKHGSSGRGKATGPQSGAGKPGGKSYTFYTDSIEFKTDGEGNLIVEGHATEGSPDKVGDIMLDEGLDDFSVQAMTKRGGIEHEQHDIKLNPNQEDKSIFPIVKARRTKIPNGVWVRAIIEKTHPRFTEVKEKLEKRILKAFSFAFRPIEGIIKNGKRYLKKIELLDIDLVSNPANPNAKITNVFMKSLDEFEIEDKAKDKWAGGTPTGKGKPPKAWWDTCTSKAGKFATDADKFCGALWAHGPSKMRDAFGKSMSLNPDNIEMKTIIDEIENLDVRDDGKIVGGIDDLIKFKSLIFELAELESKNIEKMAEEGEGSETDQETEIKALKDGFDAEIKSLTKKVDKLAEMKSIVDEQKTTIDEQAEQIEDLQTKSTEHGEQIDKWMQKVDYKAVSEAVLSDLNIKPTETKPEKGKTMIGSIGQ